MHDPETYHEPMAFKPERFLETEGQVPEMDPHFITFGFGPCICPGRFLADNTVYLSLTQTLAVFTIGNATQDRIPLKESPMSHPGVISHPSPFQCSIAVRGPPEEALILSVEKSTHGKQVMLPSWRTLAIEARCFDRLRSHLKSDKQEQISLINMSDL